MRRLSLVASLVLLASCAGGGAPSPTAGAPMASETEAAPDGPEPPDRADVADALLAYAAQHRDEFAGLYVDPPGSQRFVMLFTANLEAHAAAVVAIAPNVRVERARFTEAELEEILASAMTELEEVPGVEPIVGGIDTAGNVVTIEVKSDDPTLELRTELQYAGRVDLTVHPVPGPWSNVQEGEGWRLLAAGNGHHGEAYTVRAATDPDAYVDLWATVALGGAAPEVDYATEVVVSFGHGIGSSCLELRLDDVEISGGTVFSVTSDPLAPRACTDDLAGAAAFVVAVERARLPADGFTLQLHERTTTCADCGFVERIEVTLP